MAFTFAHEFTVTTRDGARGTIRRPGYTVPRSVCAAIVAKRTEIARLDVVALRTDGTRANVATFHGAREPLFNVSWRKVGGLTFVRLGRLSVSFCLTKKAVRQ